MCDHHVALHDLVKRGFTDFPSCAAVLITGEPLEIPADAKRVAGDCSVAVVKLDVEAVVRIRKVIR